MTYGFFEDPGCTSPLFAGVTIIDGQLSADRVIYLGTANVNAGVLRYNRSEQAAYTGERRTRIE